MAIPDFQTLMLPTLRLIKIGPTKISDAVEKLSQEFRLTQEERETLLPSGKQARMSNRVHWAITYLSKAGLIERLQRGTYGITPIGTKSLESAPSRIDIRYLHQFPQFQQFKQSGTEKTDSLPTATTLEEAAGTPEERLDAVSEELTTALQSELLERTLSLSPTAFEKLIISLMLAMGYGASGTGTHVGKSGDGGVDGTITEDALGLDVVYIQAKRYAEDNVIGVEKVREFAGTLDEKGAIKGVFVTTSKFAQGARAYSSKSTKRIILVDGKQLAKLMIDYGVGTRLFRKVEIRKIDTDYFEDLES